MSEMSFKVDNGVIDASADGGDYVPILPPPNYIVNVASLGILPTNTGVENADAWDAAIAALDPENKSMGALWVFGNGIYNFSRTLKLTRQMIIEGVAGKDSAYGTRFVFPPSTTGLHVTGYGDPLGSGAWSVVRNVRVSGSAGDDNAHGILIQRTCLLDHMFVEDFGGNGIHIEASHEDLQNANGWSLRDVNSGNNLGHGLYVAGTDANAGNAIGCDFSGNHGWGIWDESDLGNYYFGCHIDTELPDGVGLGAITALSPTSSMANNVFVGTYIENGPVNLGAQSLFLGGFHGGTFIGEGLHLYQDMVLRRPLRASFNNDSSTGFISLGGHPDDSQFMQVQLPLEDGGGTSYWTYTPETDGWVSKALGIGSWGSSLNSSMFLPTSNSNLKFLNKNLFYETNFPVFPVGIFLRANRFESIDGPDAPDGASHPNRTWNLGDKAFNRVVAPGGKIGWVCTRDGTLGSYTEGRTATATGTTGIALDAPSSVLRVGMVLNIGGSGTPNPITAIDGAELTMASVVAAGSGLSLAYSPPVFKAWGDIDP